MYVESEDNRPASLLRVPRPQAGALGAGAAFTLLAHAIIVPVMTLLGAHTAAGELAKLRAQEAIEEPTRPVDFIPAELVKRGRPLEPNKLPNRQLPTKTTAPNQPTPEQTPRAGGNAPQVEVPDAGPRPEDAEDDILMRLADRAGTLAPQIPMEQEGDPQGVEGGTARAGEADIYPGLLYTFFRRGWNVPTSLSDAELRGLSVNVVIRISQDGRMGGYEVTRPSGNADFDDSVLARLRDAEGGSLPTVPEAEAERYLGGQVTLRFTPPRRLQ